MMNYQGLVLLFVLSGRNTVGIELESLDFPSYILAGETTLMSCLYKVNQVQESELDIKWYHGTSPSPFLVYLPHHWDSPHLLDTKYSSSLLPVASSSSLMVFQLTNITKEQAGMYSCKVSTNSDEHVTSRRLNVIDKPELRLTITEDVRQLRVNCSLEAEELERKELEYEVKISSNGRQVGQGEVVRGESRTVSSARILLEPDIDNYYIECGASLLGSNYTWKVSETFHYDEVQTFQHFTLLHNSNTAKNFSSKSDVFLSIFISLVFPRLGLGL